MAVDSRQRRLMALASWRQNVIDFPSGTLLTVEGRSPLGYTYFSTDLTGQIQTAGLVTPFLVSRLFITTG